MTVGIELHAIVFQPCDDVELRDRIPSVRHDETWTNFLPSLYFYI